VAGVNGEIHTNGEALLGWGGRLGGSGGLGSRGRLGDSGSLWSNCRSWLGGHLVGVVILGLIFVMLFLMVSLFRMNFLEIIEKVVVVVDNDGLMSVNVLDDSEGVELDLVGDLVLAGDQDTVVENLDEVMQVLLNLDLVPVNTDAGV